MNKLHTTPPYTSSHRVRWDDLDANGHLRNSAYLDLSVQARFEYFASRGFTPAEFARHGIGPVVLAEQLAYKRECFLMETLTIGFRVTWIKPDGSRYALATDIYKEDGALAAQVTADAAVFDLAARRIRPAPPAFRQALEAALADPEQMKES